MKKRLLLISLALLAVVSTVFADDVIITYIADGAVIKSDTTPESSLETYAIKNLSVTDCRGYNFVGWKKGNAVEGDEMPTILEAGDMIAPRANISLYAVYQKDDAANRFVRITSAKDLRKNDQLILVCYYDSDGSTYWGPSYFALGNNETETASYLGPLDYYIFTFEYGGYTYTDTALIYAKRYKLSAEQVYPNAGVIENPANAIVWTLGGAEDKWTFTNNNKSLNISSNYGNAAIGLGNGYVYQSVTALYRNEASVNVRNVRPSDNVPDYNDHLYATTGNTFGISAANGEFNLRADNGYCLSYSEETDDYFITNTTNSWAFYIYKKESEYTSYPSCSLWSINLDAVDGTVDVTGNPHTYNKFETEAGEGIILPSASKPSGSCEDWAFAGWSPETPIKGTTKAPKLYPAGATYKPAYDGTKLYAVYTTAKYTCVTTGNTPSAGDYIIVAQNGTTYYAMGNAEHLLSANNYTVAQTAIQVNSNNEIIGEPSYGLKWSYATNNQFKNADDPSVYVNPRFNNSEYHVLGGSQNLSFSRNNNKWAIYAGNRNNWNNLDYDNGEFKNSRNTNRNNTAIYDFYLYKRTAGTYSSYPHCLKFNVHLHACGGTMVIRGDSIADLDTIESSVASGIVLPEAVPECNIGGMEFAGWLEGGELDQLQDINCTGLNVPDPDNPFVPSHDHTHLYAVYKKKIDTYQILYYTSDMVAGDDERYIITAWAGDYDYEISTNTADDPFSDYLSGVLAVSPQGEEGYYINGVNASETWIMSGTPENCTFQNVESGFLASTSGGLTQINANTGTHYEIRRPGNGFYFTMRDRDNNRYMNYDVTNNYFSTAASYNVQMYVYRQMREFTSWPHCEQFVVNYAACGGTTTKTSDQESSPGSGIILPTASANSDCRKEGWEFAGWATNPVAVESNTLPIDLYPAGVLYHPLINGDTLYAVYQQKDGSFKRITSTSDLRLGINYIIATAPEENKALRNTVKGDSYVSTKGVSPNSAGVISSADADIVWRLQGKRGAYEWCNVEDEEHPKYLDLSEHEHALIQSSAMDNFVITYARGGFVVRSINNVFQERYLGYDSENDYFNTVDEENLPTIYFYQQQALYHSNPNCVEAVDALRWDFENDSNYVYVESYLLAGLPNMHGSIGTPKECFNADTTEGPIKIKYSTAEVAPGTKTTIEWGGTRSKLTIPYVVYKNTDVDTLLTGDCSECDIVVLDGAKLTIDADKSIHNLTLYDGATLDVSDGYTLTLNSLILRCEDDQKMPTVNLNSSGDISLNNNAIYFDARIDEERYYWFSLPFDAKLQEISYSNLEANGGAPTYRTDFWVKYYDGARRVDDINNSSYTGNATGSKYWSHMAADGILKAGQGFILGIADQKDDIQDDGRKHTKRVLRFTLKAESGWLDYERVGGTKTTTVVPSVTNDSRNMAHAGWNLIGNPYMHAYTAGSSSSGVGGLRVGAWEKDDDGWYVPDSAQTLNVPYLTKYVYDETESKWKYVQVLASNTTLHPFEAVFVQINSGTSINFASLTHYIPSNAPAYMRSATYEEDTPFRTGVVLSGAGKTDATGVVLAAEYTPAYEIGADLMKMLNSKALNLYTLNADNQELAFNGLSEENAVSPIPVGVIFPSAGTYTFAFDANQYSIDGLESLVLIDKVAGTQTELLYYDYDFTMDGAATINNRFELLVRRAHKVPTDISFTSEEDQEVSARKFIREGKLFIIRDNKIYDATGARVQ